MPSARGKNPLQVCLIEANPLAEEFLIDVLAKDNLVRVVDLETLSQAATAPSILTVFLLDNCGLPLPPSEYIRRLRCRDSESRYLILDREQTREQIFRLLCFGIDGYLAYRDVSESLLPAIHSIEQGNIWVPGEILRDFVQIAKEPNRNSSNKLQNLTLREAQIIELVRRRMSNKEIAEILRIRESTVKFHLSNVFSKLQVASRHDIPEVGSRSEHLKKLIPRLAGATA